MFILPSYMIIRFIFMRACSKYFRKYSDYKYFKVEEDDPFEAYRIRKLEKYLIIFRWFSDFRIISYSFYLIFSNITNSFLILNKMSSFSVLTFFSMSIAFTILKFPFSYLPSSSPYLSIFKLFSTIKFPYLHRHLKQI